MVVNPLRNRITIRITKLYRKCRNYAAIVNHLGIYCSLVFRDMICACAWKREKKVQKHKHIDMVAFIKMLHLVDWSTLLTLHMHRIYKLVSARLCHTEFPSQTTPQNRPSAFQFAKKKTNPSQRRMREKSKHHSFKKKNICDYVSLTSFSIGWQESNAYCFHTMSLNVFFLSLAICITRELITKRFMFFHENEMYSVPNSTSK